MRILARVLFFLAGVLPGWAFALGLGEISLNSYLNQPLNAEIEVHSASTEELTNLLVTLAPAAEFSRMGIDYMPGIEQLRFSIETKPGGKNVIRVITKKDFREPFLNILIEVNWPKGRVLREYTLLVDPPVLISSKPAMTRPAVVAAPSTQKSLPAPTIPEVENMEAEQIRAMEKRSAETVVKAAEPVMNTAETTVRSDETTGSYGPTKRNDTLWKIAKKVRPDQSISMNQAMIGLLRENPDAFISNNINRLKEGYVLRVPDRAAMTSLSRKQANNEVRQQYREWKNLGRESAVAKASEASEKATTKEVIEQKEEKTGKGKLELLAPKAEGESKAEGGSKIDPNASKEEVMRQLAFTRESEEAKAQENTELRSRVTELEGQIDNNKRLFELQNDELAELKNKLAELQKEKVVVVEDVKTPVEPESKSEKQVVPAPKPKEEPGLADQWWDDPLMSTLAGAAILIMVILLAVIVKRRTGTSTGFKESILQERLPAEDFEESPVHINEVVDSLQEEGQESGEEKSPSSSYLSDFAVSSIGSMHDEVGEADPLTEADVFLAYGRFQPAEAMIQEAIENQPERNDLKFKLLEIYYAARNEGSFEREAAIFKDAVADDSMWDKVVEMGQDLCPGSVLFGGSDGAVEIEQDSASEKELHEHGSATDAEANVAIEEQPVKDTPVDFDLGDFETGIDGDVGVPSIAQVSTDDDLDLDFDLSGVGSTPSMDDLSSTDKEAENLAKELEAMASSLDSDSSLNEGDAETQAETPADFEFDTVDSSMESGEELPFSEDNEMGTKLDLARAYIDMGDPEGAKIILNEVLEGGDELQKNEAKELLQQT